MWRATSRSSRSRCCARPTPNSCAGLPPSKPNWRTPAAAPRNRTWPRWTAFGNRSKPRNAAAKVAAGCGLAASFARFAAGGRQPGALELTGELAPGGGLDANAGEHGAGTFRLLIEHLRVGMEPAQQPTLAGRDLKIDHLIMATELGIKRQAQII